MTGLKIKIGGSPQEDGAAFVEAWHRIEDGATSVEQVLTFQSWDALAALMTAERLRLMRHLHRKPEPSIVALAKSLERQYRRVHDDVTILMRSGLLSREGGSLHVTADRIEAVIELA